MGSLASGASLLAVKRRAISEVVKLLTQPQWFLGEHEAPSEGQSNNARKQLSVRLHRSPSAPNRTAASAILIEPVESHLASIALAEKSILIRIHSRVSLFASQREVLQLQAHRFTQGLPPYQTSDLRMASRGYKSCTSAITNVHLLIHGRLQALEFPQPLNVPLSRVRSFRFGDIQGSVGVGVVRVWLYQCQVLHSAVFVSAGCLGVGRLYFQMFLPQGDGLFLHCSLLPASKQPWKNIRLGSFRSVRCRRISFVAPQINLGPNTGVQCGVSGVVLRFDSGNYRCVRLLETRVEVGRTWHLATSSLPKL